MVTAALVVLLALAAWVFLGSAAHRGFPRQPRSKWTPLPAARPGRSGAAGIAPARVAPSQPADSLSKPAPHKPKKGPRSSIKFTPEGGPSSSRLGSHHDSRRSVVDRILARTRAGQAQARATSRMRPSTRDSRTCARATIRRPRGFQRAHQARPSTRSRTEIGLAEQALHRWVESRNGSSRYTVREGRGRLARVASLAALEKRWLTCIRTWGC